MEKRTLEKRYLFRRSNRNMEGCAQGSRLAVKVDIQPEIVLHCFHTDSFVQHLSVRSPSMRNSVPSCRLWTWMLRWKTRTSDDSCFLSSIYKNLKPQKPLTKLTKSDSEKDVEDFLEDMRGRIEYANAEPKADNCKKKKNTFMIENEKHRVFRCIYTDGRQ